MSDTILYIEGVAIPMRAAMEFTESWTPVGTVEVRRTWTGRAVIITPPFGTRLWDVELSGQGAATWRSPAIDGLQPGDEVVLHSSMWMTAQIPVGADQCILSLEPVDGSVYVRDTDTDVRMPHSMLTSRTVKVAEAVEKRQAVLFKPKLVALVGQVGLDASPSDGTQTWRLALHQKEPL